MAAGKAKWWYNLSTGKVERGRQSALRARIGPYDTREEAQAALEQAADQTAYWDDVEEQEREEEDFWADSDGDDADDGDSDDPNAASASDSDLR